MARDLFTGRAAQWKLDVLDDLASAPERHRAHAVVVGVLGDEHELGLERRRDFLDDRGEEILAGLRQHGGCGAKQLLAAAVS